MDTPQQAVENKKAFQAFGIEIVIIIILILIILGVLSFLNIIPIRSLIPGLGVRPTPTPPPSQGYFDPERAAQLQNTGLYTTPNPNLPKNISIVSEIPSMSPSVAQKEGLMQLFSQWGVYGRVYQSGIYARGLMGTSPLEEIVIHVTDKPQQANIYSNDGGETVYSSSYAVLERGKMNIYIQIDPTQSPTTYPQQVMFQLVNILTKMTNPVEGTAEINAREQLINSRYDLVRDASGEYFVF